MANVITNMLLPDSMQAVELGTFGTTENTMSHFGALNTFYRNTNALFDAETLAKIRDVPYTRTITIPILNATDWTVVTIRTCTINGQAIGVTQKQIIRFHVAVDVDIIPSEYKNNYISYQTALRKKMTEAQRAIYTYLDNACAAFLDSNKDITQPIGAKTLYTGAVGEFQLPKTLDFYNNLLAIMESFDVHGPYFDVANTAALADQNWLDNPGGGAIYNTKAIMDKAQIQQFEYSNRIAPGTGQRGIHYIGQVGTIGIINFIDSDYQEAPDLNTLDATDEKDISDVRYWGKINDKLFPQWQWGTMQLLDCVNEAKSYKMKMSADFALVCDFASIAGKSPIKRFSIMN